MTDWKHLQDIKGSLSAHLEGRTIGLAVCGSIAAVEVHRLARTLMRHGATVQVFLTKAAADLVSPTALAWSTGRPVITELTARCEHLEFFGENGYADLLLVAPATANTLAKIAHGLDDNVVTTSITTALGGGVPVLVAPGMHAPMMQHPALLRNLQLAESHGVEILASVLSEGKEKMMGVEEIVARVCRRLSLGELSGKRVLLTGGPTREFIDPARCLTNPSSGLSACLLAADAYRRGAEVTLVYGPGSVKPPSWIKVRPVLTAEEMMEAVLESLGRERPDFVVATAAVSDFRPVEYLTEKRPTRAGGFQLALEPTPKVIKEIRARVPEVPLVAFKASSAKTDPELEQAARVYLDNESADLVVANTVGPRGEGFDSDSNRYLLFQSERATTVLGPSSKRELAVSLWDQIVHRFLA